MWCFWSVYTSFILFYIYIWSPIWACTPFKKVPSTLVFYHRIPRNVSCFPIKRVHTFVKDKPIGNETFFFGRRMVKFSTKDLSPKSKNPNQRPTWWRKTTFHTMDKNACYFVLLQVVTWNVVLYIQRNNFSKSPISQLNKSNKRFPTGKTRFLFLVFCGGKRVSCFLFWVVCREFSSLRVGQSEQNIPSFRTL